MWLILQEVGRKMEVCTQIDNATVVTCSPNTWLKIIAIKSLLYVQDTVY